MIRSVSRGFIFTTAAPPTTMAGARAAIDFQRNNPSDRMQLQRHVRAVKARLLQHGLPVLPNTSYIVPLMVGDSGNCKAAADILFDEFDIYVQPINSPSVAVGQERLRISPTAAHTQSHQDHLIDALVQVWDRLGLDRLEHWKGRGINGSVSEGWEDLDALGPVWIDAQLSISEPDIFAQRQAHSLQKLASRNRAIENLEDTRFGR